MPVLAFFRRCQLILGRFLNTKTCSVICLMLAVLNRSLVQIFFFRFRDDRAYQIVATGNWLKGKGITLNQVLPDNLFHEVYLPLTGWPPGYSSFLYGISQFTDDLISAALVFEVLCVIILVASLRYIMKLLGCSIELRNIWTLYTGLFFYDFTETSTTDFNALAFLLLALSIALLFIQKQNVRVIQALLLGLVNFLPAFLRYMYIPIAFVIPVCLLFYGWKRKRRDLKRAGVISGSVTLLLMFGLLAFQKIYTGNATHLYPMQTGFFPSNLSYYYPFSLVAFADVAFYYTLADKFNIIRYGQYHEVLKVLTYLLLLVTGWLFWRLFKQKQQTTLQQPYLLMAVAIGVIINGLLILLSLRYKLLRNTWTYVAEPRYFAPILVLMQQVVFLSLFGKGVVRKRWWWRFTKVGFILISVFEMAHGIYFFTKTSKDLPAIVAQRRNELPLQLTIDSLLAEARKQYSNEQIIFCSSDFTFTTVASLSNARCLYQVEKMENLFRQNRPLTAIIALPQYDTLYIQRLKPYRVQKVAAVKGVDFYVYSAMNGKSDGERQQN